MQPQSATAQSDFDTFLDGLIEEKFIKQGHNIEPEIRWELKKDISIQLNDFIMARVIAALSDEDVLAFEGLLKENKSQEALQTFAVDHIPDFTTFLTDVLLEFQKIYLS